MPDESAPDAPAMLTVREVAETLRVDATTVRRWITSSILSAVALPASGKRKCYRIHRAALDELLAGQQ